MKTITAKKGIFENRGFNFHPFLQNLQYQLILHPYPLEYRDFKGFTSKSKGPF